MNANELANLLEVDSWYKLVTREEIATMLRQQQEQIDKLTAIVALREMEIEALKKKQQEVLAEVKTSWTAISPVSGIQRESAHQLYAVLKDIMK
jgi:hypothetical protein